MGGTCRQANGIMIKTLPTPTFYCMLYRSSACHEGQADKDGGRGVAVLQQVRRRVALQDPELELGLGAVFSVRGAERDP